MVVVARLRLGRSAALERHEGLLEGRRPSILTGFGGRTSMGSARDEGDDGGGGGGGGPPGLERRGSSSIFASMHSSSGGEGGGGGGGCGGSGGGGGNGGGGVGSARKKSLFWETMNNLTDADVAQYDSYQRGGGFVAARKGSVQMDEAGQMAAGLAALSERRSCSKERRSNSGANLPAQLRDRATSLFHRQQSNSGGGWMPLPRRLSLVGGGGWGGRTSRRASCAHSRGSRSSSTTSSEAAGEAAARHSELALLPGLRRTAGQVRMIHRLSRRSPLIARGGGGGRNLARIGPNLGVSDAGVAAAPRESKDDEVEGEEKGASVPAAE